MTIEKRTAANGSATIYLGDMREVLRTLPENSIDAIVCDPPYEINFMGKGWDASGVAFQKETWAECLRVLKPGGYLVAFGATRTSHRITCAIEDAGFEIRDTLQWVFGSGFPKSLDVGKAIDKSDAPEEQHARRLRFTEWVRSHGVTARQINKATGTQMGNHYTTHQSQPSIMTREHLELCRHLFADIPDWVVRECDIRSVESEIFKNRHVVGSKKGLAGGGFGDTYHGLKTGEIPVTAPATDLARQWHGYGTALKPAHEPITLARKPLSGTVARNVAEWGTGGIDVDGCRVGDGKQVPGSLPRPSAGNGIYGHTNERDPNAPGYNPNVGRWPPNIILGDGAGDVIDEMSGNASEFFPTFCYTPKASRKEREAGLAEAGIEPMTRADVTEREEGSAGLGPHAGTRRQGEIRNTHPTVKPVAIMQWLVRLVSPPRALGPVVLDPFCGSGTTGIACMMEGVRFIGCELDPRHADIATSRLDEWYVNSSKNAKPDPRARALSRRKI